MRRVVLTGVGVLNAAIGGGSAALGAYLGAPRSALRPTGAAPGRLVAELAPSALAGLVDATETRRLSRVCQFAVAAARLALADAGLEPSDELGLVVGTEFGDLGSTVEFADGYLERGPAGLSALLFPSTVMNTMAAASAIAVVAKGLSLTLNAPAVAGELAVARAAALVRTGRLEVALAGGVDQIDPLRMRMLAELGAASDVRGEGATFVVLEALPVALERRARVLGEILGASWSALPARPHGVGRHAGSRAIAAALEAAATALDEVGWVYASASGDWARDAWERALLAAALGGAPRAVASLGFLVGHHAGAGALGVAAGAWTSRSGLLPVTAAPGADADRAPAPVAPVRVRPGPGLVHGVARGGTHVALAVGPPPGSQ
ncbi:MAG: hypothetical protein HY727_06160 [Candidatus Rokubacteria bacterium]|nr:hypothetical protein [Candidatus Rokubacteria bacterium]